MKPPPSLISDMRLDGLHRPLRLVNCGAFFGTIAETLPNWPYQLVEQGDVEPMAVLAFAGATFRVTSPFIEGPKFHKTAVNALCDVIALLPWALAAQRADLMVLHAAAVEIGGCAVLFPAVRRSGKSLLSAGLAAAGAGIISDDTVALSAGAGAALMVRASGIATRLRLPLPDDLPKNFRDFLAAHRGPENDQYRYFPQPNQPSFGAAFPIGGVVILDRQESGAARLQPEPRGEVLRVLLHQHFTRQRDSAQVMAALYLMAKTAPCFRLVYARVQDGIDLILQAAAEGKIAAPNPAPIIQPLGGDKIHPRPPAPKDHRYTRAQGADIRDLDGQDFAVSRDGGRIVHLNEGAMRIWMALTQPATQDEITALLAQAFPQVAPDIITRDTAEALTQFYRMGLLD